MRHLKNVQCVYVVSTKLVCGFDEWNGMEFTFLSHTHMSTHTLNFFEVSHYSVRTVALVVVLLFERRQFKKYWTLRLQDTFFEFLTLRVLEFVQSAKVITSVCILVYLAITLLFWTRETFVPFVCRTHRTESVCSVAIQLHLHHV